MCGHDSKAVEIMRALPETTQRAVALEQKQRAGAWLNTLPIEIYGFSLHKGAFRDALALRYKDGTRLAWPQSVRVARAMTSNMPSTVRQVAHPPT